MSNSHNDIEFSKRKTTLPMSISSIISERKNKSKQELRLEYYARTELYRKVQGVNAVKLQDLIKNYPEVQTEDDVDRAADLLIGVFDCPNSRAFYCDRARHIKDVDFIIQAVLAAFQPGIQYPPRYFGVICTRKIKRFTV